MVKIETFSAAMTRGTVIAALVLVPLASTRANNTHPRPPANPATAGETRGTGGADTTGRRKVPNRQPGTGTTQVGGRRSYFPHGGWLANRYVYFPDAGFGRSGLYSWYYGQPYGSAYPYAYYVQSPYDAPSPGGTVTSLPAWLRASPGSAWSSYGSFSFVGPQASAFPAWSASYPYNSYPPSVAPATPQPWLAPGTADGWAQGDGAENWAAGYFQALMDAEQRRREPWVSVTLQVEPAAAALFVDGNPVGTAEQFARPGTVLGLPAGNYHLEIAAPGFETEAVDLVLAPGQSLILRRQLKEAAPQEPPRSDSGRETQPRTGTVERPRGEVLFVVSPTDARVTVDGHFACRVAAPGQEFRCRLTAGPHTVEVTRDGYQSHKEEVIVSPLQPLAREVRLKSR